MQDSVSPQDLRSPSVVMLTQDRRVDRRILLQAESLESAGWSVAIVAMPRDDDGRDDDPRIVRIGSDTQGNEKENRVLDMYRFFRRRLPMNGFLMRFLKHLAWRFVVDQEAFFLRLFSGTAEMFSPDVFVADDLPMLPTAWQAARRCGAKLVYDSHELFPEQEFPERIRRRWTEIEAKYIGDCDLVMTVNASIARELERRYGVRDVQAILNAEKSSFDRACSTLFHELFGLDRLKKIVLFQGGLSSGRNLDVLIQAMRLVTNPDIHLVFLGEGLLRKRLERLVRGCSVASRVHFLDAVPQSELLRYTRAADCGVIPYTATCLNNYFCTPNKLYEFIAAGIPILASDLPEIRRLVIGNDIGIVGDFLSPVSAASLLDSFFSDETRLRIWRENLSRVRQSVCWETEGKKIIELFEAFR